MEQAVKVRENEAKRLKANAETLKPLARLEDLHVWQMEKTKTTKKGSRKYACWMVIWREDGKTRIVHLGSSRKMDAKAALLKARMLKTEAIKC
jgi:hypothetical protein